MQYHIFQQNINNTYPLAVLIKDKAFQVKDLERYYLNKLEQAGVPRDQVIFVSLDYQDKKKVTAGIIKAYLPQLFGFLEAYGSKYLLVADAEYFKKITKVTKADVHHGYAKGVGFPGMEYMQAVLSINYQSLFYNPSGESKLDQSIATAGRVFTFKYADPGRDIIHFSAYPESLEEISNWLNKLHSYPELACDIETFGLSIDKAGLGTVGFAWNQHEGIAFPVDLGYREPVVSLLRTFFETYKGVLIYHGGTFDIKMLIVRLWMKNLQDWKGMIHGMKVMYQRWKDSLLTVYLATNSTAGNTLGLKANAQEFAGNYAQEEINDITAIPLDELLEYNLVDCLATWFVLNKYEQKMLDDMQQSVYDEIFHPSMRVITAMEIVGMPMDMTASKQADSILSTKMQQLQHILENNSMIQKFEFTERRIKVMEDNILLKTKVRQMEDVEFTFNPASPKQVQNLLFRDLGLEPVDFTETKQPATGAKTLKKIKEALINQFDITEDELL